MFFHDIYRDYKDNTKRKEIFTLCIVKIFFEGRLVQKNCFPPYKKVQVTFMYNIYYNLLNIDVYIRVRVLKLIIVSKSYLMYRYLLIEIFLVFKISKYNIIYLYF